MTWMFPAGWTGSDFESFKIEVFALECEGYVKYCLFHRGHFEDMSAQYLMRVEQPLKAVLDQSSMSILIWLIISRYIIWVRYEHIACVLWQSWAGMTFMRWRLLEEPWESQLSKSESAGFSAKMSAPLSMQTKPLLEAVHFRCHSSSLDSNASSLLVSLRCTNILQIIKSNVIFCVCADCFGCSVRFCLQHLRCVSSPSPIWLPFLLLFAGSLQQRMESGLYILTTV